ncbi:hypothetical protein HV198_20290 [Citrobacter freundii]|uniref:hypothetical protein n=1 Tax=Citrobacter freundii TaxID=546 RepID=UPI0015E5208B|nr:hypothetical protein [Citrobacter freundii]QLO44351.1 hypothetical protein HV215_20285 [Citrobacter freundii]QLV42515.1 hypothetical protein HV198_20290 [Citrobacter freundii]
MMPAIPGVYVYIWDFRFKPFAFGHASLEVVRTGEPRVYISWWPDDARSGKKISKNIYSAYPVINQTHADVISLEENPPNHTIFIRGQGIGRSGVNTENIIEFWDALSLESREERKSGPLLPWKTFTLNCSTVVFEALKAGGALTYSGEPRWSSIPWNPNSVKEFALSVKHNIELAVISGG